jgi:hypothetical protein
MAGAIINYCILAPWMINRGDIIGKVSGGAVHYGFKSITMWALWGGVAREATAASHWPCTGNSGRRSCGDASLFLCVLAGQSRRLDQ